jgi:gliding motility-associated-like protein
VVYAATEHGCKVVDSIKINVDEATIIDLPNAFTPGGNVNGEFKIIKRGIATLNYFRIFNRWGNLVFSTNNIDEGWNGEYKGVPQSTDVFVYQVEAVTSTGKIIRKQGNVTLLR